MTRRTAVHVIVAAMFLCGAAFSVGQDSSKQTQTSHISRSGHINFSFDQVDVKTFVKLVGDITGRKFVVADDVDRKITIVSPLVKPDEVYPLFLSILESAGCSVVQDDKIHRVVALPKREIPVVPVIGVNEHVTSLGGIVTKIFHLQSVSAQDVARLLSSSISGGAKGAVGAIEETNHLIVTDTAESIRRVEKIVTEIDRPGLARITEIVPLKFAGAQDVANQLTMAVAENVTRASALRNRLPTAPDSSGDWNKREPSIIASQHSNSLLLVGTQSQIADLKRIVADMDVDAPSGRGRLNAIFLKYVPAEEAAKSISTLLEKTYNKQQQQQDQRRIAIAPSVVNNALLVDAMPGDFDVVKKLVDQLDQIPQQVHIDVLIIEHSIDDDVNIGVEMAALGMPSEVGDSVVLGANTLNSGTDTLMSMIQNGVIPGGLTVGIARGIRTDADGNLSVGYPGVLNINAFKKKGAVKLRSQTSLEAQNNREATVSIVNEIPILKSTIEGGSGTARDVIQNIDRIDVGVKLKLTPHVVPGGDVQMTLNPSIEAVIDSGSGDVNYTPTIARREVSTTVTVPNGRTIVIAGLTREDQSKVVRKVPILGSIPILGILFRHKIENLEKTNLIILVTPHIVTDIAAAENIMTDWRKKTDL
ncbi:MAG: hypothetical protein JXN60_00460 [Lentisphaerae bacterium]|nr:hypothetical protein [Lentisphaerota bacterium]